MNLPHSAAAVVVCTSIKAFYSRFLIERQTRAFISRNSTSLSDLTEENLHWKSRRVFIQSCIREKICTIYALKRHLRTFALSPQPTQEDVHPSSAMKIKTCSVRQVYEFIALCMDDEVRKWIFRKLTNRPRTIFFLLYSDKRQTQTILPEPSLSIVWTMLLTTAMNRLSSNLIDGQKRQNLLKSQS